MRTFEIVALSVGGRGNRIHNSGAIVREDQFLPNSVGTLLLTKAIREVKGVNESSFDAPDRFKVAIITAMWKRPEVFELFGHAVNALISDVTEVDFEVFCVGSEGETSRNLARSFGFDYIEHSNDRLGEKWGACVEFAAKSDPNYYLMMGSDDVMDSTLFRRYLPYMACGIDFIGVLDWYFYDMNSQKALYWSGYRGQHNRGMTCGAGRMISSQLMRQLQFNPWRGNRLNKRMDSTMNRNLNAIKHSQAAFFMGEGSHGLGVDIKSDTNISKFTTWDNCKEIDPTLIQTKFILTTGSTLTATKSTKRQSSTRALRSVRATA